MGKKKKQILPSEEKPLQEEQASAVEEIEVVEIEQKAEDYGEKIQEFVEYTQGIVEKAKSLGGQEEIIAQLKGLIEQAQNLEGDFGRKFLAAFQDKVSGLEKNLDQEVEIAQEINRIKNELTVVEEVIKDHDLSEFVVQADNIRKELELGVDSPRQIKIIREKVTKLLEDIEDLDDDFSIKDFLTENLAKAGGVEIPETNFKQEILQAQKRYRELKNLFAEDEQTLQRLEELRGDLSGVSDEEDLTNIEQEIDKLEDFAISLGLKKSETAKEAEPNFSEYRQVLEKLLELGQGFEGMLVDISADEGYIPRGVKREDFLAMLQDFVDEYKEVQDISEMSNEELEKALNSGELSLDRAKKSISELSEIAQKIKETRFNVKDVKVKRFKLKLVKPEEDLENENEKDPDLENLKKHIEFFQEVSADLNFKFIKNELNRPNNKYGLDEDRNHEAYDIASRLVQDFYDFRDKGYENMSDEELQELLDSGKIKLEAIEQITADIKRLSELTGLEIESIEPPEDGVEKESIPENKKALSKLQGLYLEVGRLFNDNADQLDALEEKVSATLDAIFVKYSPVFDELNREFASEGMMGDQEEIDTLLAELSGVKRKFNWDEYKLDDINADFDALALLKEKMLKILNIIDVEINEEEVVDPNGAGRLSKDDQQPVSPDDQDKVDILDVTEKEEANLERDIIMARLIKKGMDQAEARKKAEFLAMEKGAFENSPEFKGFLNDIYTKMLAGGEIDPAEYPELSGYFSPETIQNIIEGQRAQVRELASSLESFKSKGWFKKLCKGAIAIAVPAAVGLALSSPLGLGLGAAWGAAGLIGSRTAWNIFGNLRRSRAVTANEREILEQLKKGTEALSASGAEAKKSAKKSKEKPNFDFAQASLALQESALIGLFEAEKRKISGEYIGENGLLNEEVLFTDAKKSLEGQYPDMSPEDLQDHAKRIVLLLHTSQNNEHKETELLADKKKKDIWFERLRNTPLGKLLERDEARMFETGASSITMGIGMAVLRGMPGFGAILGGFAGFKMGGALGNIAERKLVYKYKKAEAYPSAESMSEKDALLLRQQVLYFPEKSLKNPEYTKLSERLYQYELIQVQKREKLEELSKLLAEDNSQLSQVEKSHKKKVVVATAVAVGSRLAGATLGAFVGNYLEGLFADSPAPEAAPAVIETPKPEPFVVQGDYLERMMNNAQARFIDENMVPGGQLDGVEAGKMLNVTHNILRMMDGHSVAGIEPSIDGLPVSDIVHYDAKTNTLEILDPEKFEHLVDQLWGRSPVTELTANGSGAVAGAGGYSSGTWDRMLQDSNLDLANGAENLRGDGHVQAAIANMNAAQEFSLNAALDNDTENVQLSMRDAYNGEATLPDGREVIIRNGIISSVGGEAPGQAIDVLDTNAVHDIFATGVATESVETIVTGAAEQAAKVYSAGIETLLNESGQDGSVLDKLGWIGSLRAEDFLNNDYKPETEFMSAGYKPLYEKLQDYFIEKSNEIGLTSAGIGGATKVSDLHKMLGLDSVE